MIRFLLPFALVPPLLPIDKIKCKRKGILFPAENAADNADHF